MSTDPYAGPEPQQPVGQGSYGTSGETATPPGAPAPQFAAPGYPAVPQHPVAAPYPSSQYPAPPQYGAVPPPYGATPQYGTPGYGAIPQYAAPQYGATPQYGAPGYGAIPQYAAPQYGVPQYGPAPYPFGTLVAPPAYRGMSIAGFVLALVSLFSFLIPFIGLTLAVLGVVFGHISLSRLRHYPPPQQGRGLTIAALVLGYLGIVVSVIAWIGFAVAYGSSS